MSLMGSFAPLTRCLKGIGNKGVSIWIVKFLFNSKLLPYDFNFVDLQSLQLWLLLMLVDF